MSVFLCCVSVFSAPAHVSFLWFHRVPAAASAPHAGSGSEGPGDQHGALAEPPLLPTLQQELRTPGVRVAKVARGLDFHFQPQVQAAHE